MLSTLEPGQPSTMEVCARLSQDEHLAEVPVLVAVAVDELPRLEGVDQGHELLITPFVAGELGVRIARARRAITGLEHDDVIHVDDLVMDLPAYRVTVGGRPLDLTYMEFELLRFLVTHPRRAFTREALLARVWDRDFYGGARTVDVHVRRLRDKLGGELGARIKTVRSVGYRWEDG